MFDFFKSGWKRTVHLENAAIFPLTRDSMPHTVRGGIRHPDMPPEFHQHTNLARKGLGTDKAYLSAQPEPTVTLEGRGLYAGPLFRHYGHFLAESIHRLWAWMQDPDAFDYIAVLPQARRPSYKPTKGQDLPSYQQDILSYIGVPLDLLTLVTEPMIAKDITVPKQASLLDRRVRTPKSYIEFWAEHEARTFAGADKMDGPVPERLYVSRANYLANGSLAGEYYLEHLFAEAGFHVIRPETLPILEQLRLYRGARLLVFSEGSAFHTLELLGPLKGDIVCLQRRPGADDLWRTLLSDRCCHLSFTGKVTALPSLALTQQGHEKANTALSLLDAPALVTYLREAGYASLDSFDQNKFWEAEAADVGRYLVNTQLKSADALGQTATQLNAFRGALEAHGNPYLKKDLPAL